MFFIVFFVISLFFFKNIIYSWIAMEILTLVIVFFCSKNNTVKNIIKLFYYLIIHTLLGFILIYLIIFSYERNIIFLLLCAKLGRFPRFWIPEVMPFFSNKNFFILISLPKLYPMLFFFFLNIDNADVIKIISFFSIFFRSIRSLFSNDFKKFFTYARISQIRFFFLVLIVKISLFLLFVILYFIVLVFFYKNMIKNINFLSIICFLSYRRLPFRLPFYFKYIVILNLRNRFIFFFFFFFYYLFILVFLRYTIYFNKKYRKSETLFFIFFFLYLPFFFFFIM